MTSLTLRAALDSLAGVAASVGVDPVQARLEGIQLAAAVSEPATGAFLDWADQLGRPANAQEFFEAAARGRRWRAGPTPLMSQLGNTNRNSAHAYANALIDVSTAACALGEPNPKVAGAAASASAAQQQAVSGVGQVPTSNASGPHGGLDPDLLARLQRSEERVKAMDEFTRNGGQVFQSVLDQLAVNQQRLQELRGGPLLTPTGGPPAQPADSAPSGSGERPAPTATQDAPDAKPVAEVDEPAEPTKTVEELLAELDALVGLDEVKAEIHRQAAVLRVQALRSKAGLKVPTITRHMVFVGNPGTGKTTVARLVGGVYRALGLLSKGQLIEVDRSEMVAGYLGQTALKSAEVIASAIGGVLFIDEAYALSGDQYGEESINTLVKEMEDNRDDLVVIVAGYPGPMARFIAENPGLASRFRTTIFFDDYTDDELVAIFQLQVKGADYVLAEGCLEGFRRLLGQQIRDETFGNGRFCRNVLEAAIGHQAWRLRDVVEPTVDELRTLLSEDLLGAPEPPSTVGDELLVGAAGQTDESAGQAAAQAPTPDAASTDAEKPDKP